MTEPATSSRSAEPDTDCVEQMTAAIDPTRGATMPCPCGCGGRWLRKAGPIHTTGYWSRLPGGAAICKAPEPKAMTPWHAGWQAACAARHGWQTEMLNVDGHGEYHWADAVSPAGQVVEFQHSAISREEIRSRITAHSGPMWVLDATKVGPPFDLRPDASETDIEFIWPGCPPWVLTLLQETERLVLDTRTELLSVMMPSGSKHGAVFRGVRLASGPARQQRLLNSLDRFRSGWSAGAFRRLVERCPGVWLDALLEDGVTPNEAGLWLHGRGHIDGLYRVHQLCSEHGYAAPHPDAKNKYSGHYGSWLDKIAAGTDAYATVESWFEHYGAHTHLLHNDVPPAIASLWEGRGPDIAIRAQRHCVANGTSLHTINRHNRPAMQALKQIDYEARVQLRATPIVVVPSAHIDREVDAWANEWLR